MSENRELSASIDTKREREGDEEGGDNNGMYVGDVYVCDIGVFKCYRIDAFLIMIDWIGH
jgi:hypothetical protein